MYAVRLITFILISCCAHLLLMQFDIAQQAVPKYAQQYGVDYVVRSAEQFVVAASQPSVANAHTGKVRPEISKPKPRVLAEQVTKAPDKSENATLPHKPLIKPSKVEAFEVAKPVLAIAPQQSIRIEKPESASEQSPVALRGEFQGESAAEVELVGSLAEIGSSGQVEGVSEALPRYDINPLPVYPEAALRRGQQGTVQLEVLVLADGRVGRTRLMASSGFSSLDRAAQKAVKRWKFEPATSTGINVESRVVIPVDFVLENH